ncbi:S26 family signal peptidase [Dactylosporangium salmoneum]|uniref:Mitochondrial inner membrane protease subunit 2 n=1 Tax=Dactylosporangium salmoneum TaxID=53361 RepID=A0ABN3GJN0_9ACTN
MLIAIATAVIPAAAAALAVVVLRRRYLVVDVTGPSMTPTYLDGDRVLVRRVRGDKVRPGQVVVLEGPRLPRAEPLGLLLKRVTAVPGDAVPAYVTGAPALVPAGKLVVLSDNPAAGVDSRSVGLFSAAGVAGVVLRRM